MEVIIFTMSNHTCIYGSFAANPKKYGGSTAWGKTNSA